MLEVVLPRDEVGNLLRLVADKTSGLEDIEVYHASLDDLYLYMSASRVSNAANGKVVAKAQRVGSST